MPDHVSDYTPPPLPPVRTSPLKLEAFPLLLLLPFYPSSSASHRGVDVECVSQETLQKKKREKVTLPHPYLMFHPHREQILQNQTGGITRRQQKENTSVTQSLSHSVGVGAHVWFTSPPRFLKVDLTLKAKDLRVQHIKAGVFPAPSEVEGNMVFWFRFYPTTT